MAKIKICNGQLLTPYRNLGLGTVIVEDGKIVALGQGDIEAPDAEVIDAGGAYISPGFIDLHTHGGGGHDFMDGTEEAFYGALKLHAEHGTTTLFPTTLTSNNDELYNAFDIFRKVKASTYDGAGMGGLHLEGPYFAASQSGAQDPRYLRTPKPEEYNEILAKGGDIIKRWTIAPELPGAMEFGRDLTRSGVKVALSHTDAIHEEVEEAFENGFNHITHFYSCMNSVIRRNAYRIAGPIESGYLLDEMTVEIIADGKHLPSSLLKLVYKQKGAFRIALVTDSMRGAGQADGTTSILGSLKDGQEVIIEDGVAKMPSRTAFAGSVATADRLVRTMIQQADVSVIDAVRMMTSTPANIAGISMTKGSLIEGKDADIVIFVHNVDVKMTMVEGRVVYRK